MSRVLQTRVFFLLCAFGVIIRLVLIATTVGTNDAMFWGTWAKVVEEAGVSGAYSYSRMVNHPPLALVLVLLTDTLSRASGIIVTDVFRFFQVVADVLSAFALYRIGIRAGVQWGRALALFVLLSPAAAFVSGFHCNSDPMMIALVALAAMLMSGSRTDSAAVVLALAAGIKVVPILLVPIFTAGIARRSRFIAIFALATAIIYLPAIVAGGPVVIRNIFGYAGGLPYEWGLPGLAFAASHAFPSMRSEFLAAMGFYHRYGRYAVYVGILAVIVLAFRRRSEQPLTFTAILFLTMFALAPGFGVQYMAWLIPVLPFALPWRGALAMNAAISVFLFVTYTVWNGGWPWWFADIARPGPYRFLAAIAGYVMWGLVCAALFFALKTGSRRETELRMPIAALPTSPGSD